MTNETALPDDVCRSKALRDVEARIAASVPDQLTQRRMWRTVLAPVRSMTGARQRRLDRPVSR